MKFEIWSEGYHVNEGRSPAHCHGVIEAESFNEAVYKLAVRDAGFAAYLDIDRMTFWGCKLFPTEEEARQAYG